MSGSIFENRLKKLRYIPLDVLETPRAGNCLVDQYWVVHPEKGAAFYEADQSGSGALDRFRPQSNSQREVASRIMTHMYPAPFEIRKIDVAYLNHIIDYKDAA